MKLKKQTPVTVTINNKIFNAIWMDEYNLRGTMMNSVELTEPYNGFTSYSVADADLQVPECNLPTELPLSPRARQLQKSLDHYVTEREKLLKLLPSDPMDNKPGYRQLHKLEAMIDLRKKQLAELD